MTDTTALPLDRARTILLLEALGRHEEYVDAAGCVADAVLARVLLHELRLLARVTCR